MELVAFCAEVYRSDCHKLQHLNLSWNNIGHAGTCAALLRRRFLHPATRPSRRCCRVVRRAKTQRQTPGDGNNIGNPNWDGCNGSSGTRSMYATSMPPKRGPVLV